MSGRVELTRLRLESVKGGGRKERKEESCKWRKRPGSEDFATRELEKKALRKSEISDLILR